MRVTSEITYYKDQATRAIKENMAGRVGDAANFLRRTTRAAVGQRPPQPGMHAAVGDPPYRQSGGLYNNVGWDKDTQEATVSVSSYGQEIGKGMFGGKARPHLLPCYLLNRIIIGLIIAGRISAPRVGNIGKALNRVPPGKQTKKTKNGVKKKWFYRKVNGVWVKCVPGWNKGQR